MQGPRSGSIPMNTHTPGTSPAFSPSPARFWYRAIRWALPLIVVLGVVQWFAWDWWMTRRLNTAIDRWRSAGRPFWPDDLPLPAVPPEQDGFPLLQEAAENCYFPREQRERLRPRPGPQWPDDPHTVRAAVASCADSLAQLREIRARPHADWQVDITSPGKFPVLVNGGKIRSLLTVAGAAAVLDARQGDSASALRRLDEILHAARLVGEHPSLIGPLVRAYCEREALRALQVCMPHLKITEEARGAGGTVSGRQARDLVNALLDDASLAAAVQQALYGECLIPTHTILASLRGEAPLFDWVRYWITGRGNPERPVAFRDRVLAYGLAPLWKANAAALLDYMGAAADAAASETLAEARSRMPPPPDFDATRTYMLVYEVFYLTAPRLNRYIELIFQARALRRIAATALAARTFEAQHGRLPRNLDELVPAYLPAVPSDPLAPDRASLRYLPDVEFPRVYSLGLNGVDDGGDYYPVQVSKYRKESPDLVFFISHVPPDADLWP